MARPIKPRNEIICPNCKSHILVANDYRSSPGPEPNTVTATWPLPPNEYELCPNCSQTVDTKGAYPFIDGFPPSWASLKAAYSGMSTSGMFRNISIDQLATEDLNGSADTQTGSPNCFNTPDGLDYFKKAMFYRSTKAFYRSAQLFLTFLLLEKRAIHSWAKVTGYYSRFFFVQALLNLLLLTKVGKKFILYYKSGDVASVSRNKWATSLKSLGSHEIWWGLLESIKMPVDYPSVDLPFVLSNAYFNAPDRNNVNYDFEDLGGGFIELDGFSLAEDQMRSQMQLWDAREDRDITSIDGYFKGINPENCDPDNYYEDSAQIIWRSLIMYLTFLRDLEISQELITVRKISLLTDAYLKADFPEMSAGITAEVSSCFDF